MAITQFSTLADDAATYIRDSLLEIAEVNVVFGQHALMADLPQHNSKTCQFSRYPRLGLPLTPVATEGTTPTDQSALAVETVQAVTDQWILIVGLTDIAQLTVKHPLIPIVTDLLGLAQAELVDREIQKALMADASVTWASTTSRAGLLSTLVVSSTVLGAAWATLRRNGARPFGMNYALIVDPEVSQDIMANTTFVSVHSFQNVKAIGNNVVGSFMGFDVEVSNFIPVIISAASAGFTVGTTGTGVLSVDGVTTSWTVSTPTVFVVVEAVNSATGLVEKVYVPGSDPSVEISTEGLVVTVPSTTGFVYNIYASTVHNSSAVTNLYLVVEAAVAASVNTINEILTTEGNPQAQPPSGVKVHTSYAIGRESYGMVKLSGDNLRVLMTDGKPSDSDPAAQRRKISLKGSFKALVLNSDWVLRVESGSAYLN